MKDMQSDIKRAFKSWGFWIGAAGMVIAILIGTAGNILPVLQEGTHGGLQNGFHVQILLKSITSDVMLLCVPILAALPYTSAFLDDFKSGYLKEYLPRSGKSRYIKGKVAATALSGGLCLFVGIFAAYLIFCLVFTPMELAPEKGMMQQPLFPQVLGSACIFFLCGSLWSLVGALFASATLSRYMAYASPFIIYYVLVILSERYLKNIYVLNPKEWLRASESWPGGGWGDALMLAVLITAVSLGLAVSITRRLGDA